MDINRGLGLHRELRPQLRTFFPQETRVLNKISKVKTLHQIVYLLSETDVSS